MAGEDWSNNKDQLENEAGEMVDLAEEIFSIYEKLLKDSKC